MQRRNAYYGSRRPAALASCGLKKLRSKTSDSETTNDLLLQEPALTPVYRDRRVRLSEDQESVEAAG